MVLHARSPSLQYQVKLLEEEVRQGNTRPSNSKTRKAIEILHEIIPFTGVYKDVLVLVLNTLKQAIYSSTLTSQSCDMMSSQPRDMMPSQSRDMMPLPDTVYLPYFEMVFRLEEEKNTAEEVLKDESEQLRCEVSKTKHESESIAAMLDKKTKKIDDLKLEIQNLKEELSERGNTLSKLEYTISGLNETIVAVNHDIVQQKMVYEATLAKKEDDISAVTTYKANHHELQTDFFRLSTQSKDTNERREPESRVLQGQLVTILNNLLEEQDSFRDRYNSLVLSSTRPDCLTEWNKRYILIREIFAKLGRSVLNELKLLNTHINYEKKVRDGEEGAEEDQEQEQEVNVSNLFAEGKDPFYSKEVITAKYSAALEISTNECLTFSHLGGSRACVSCEAMVFICPHLFFTEETVINLPRGSTHLKVTRPLLRVAPTDCLREALALSSEEAEGPPPPKPGDKSRDLRKKQAGMWRGCLKEPYHRARDLAERHVATCVEHYCLYLGNLRREELYTSSLALLSDYLLGVYQLGDLANLVKVDLLDAVSRYSPSNPFIAIFGYVLAGTLDTVMFKYIYMLNEIVLQLDLVCPLDLRPLMIVLYPNLTDEDIDPHVLSYSSHSNNKISPYLVSRYLMHCIVRDKEPRIVECISKLRQNCGHSPIKMTYEEFSVAMETVYPLATNKSKEHHYKCSMSNTGGGVTHVDTRLLGQVVAYLQLQDTYPKIISEINTKIHHYRTKIPPEMVELGLKQKRSQQFVNIPSTEQARKQLTLINKAAKSLELLHSNPCWREDVDIAPLYLDLTTRD